MEWRQYFLHCLSSLINIIVSNDACFLVIGEFTLRAFLNGRLDLSQAENVGQLVTASSACAADSALAGIQAYFKTRYLLL